MATDERNPDGITVGDVVTWKSDERVTWGSAVWVVTAVRDGWYDGDPRGAVYVYGQQHDLQRAGCHYRATMLRKVTGDEMSSTDRRRTLQR